MRKSNASVGSKITDIIKYLIDMEKDGYCNIILRHPLRMNYYSSLISYSPSATNETKYMISCEMDSDISDYIHENFGSDLQKFHKYIITKSDVLKYANDTCDLSLYKGDMLDIRKMIQYLEKMSSEYKELYIQYVSRKGRVEDTITFVTQDNLPSILFVEGTCTHDILNYFYKEVNENDR